MKILFKIWRQSESQKGSFEEHQLNDVSPDQSLFECLDTINNGLEKEGKEAFAFDSDCREGICGTCSLYINGMPHGPGQGVTSCQVHMRSYKDGETITIEPWRSRAFPVIKDLVVDRSSFDRIIQSGGYISVKTGSAVDANATPINKKAAEEAFDAAACIGCGACVAACDNSSAMLFVAAKISHLALLPQGSPERRKRALSMVDTMDKEDFGNCTNLGACSAACPKEISVTHIARLNREYVAASLTGA